MNLVDKQKQWFNYLQSCNYEELQTAISRDKYHSKWLPYKQFNELVNLRLPIDQEIIVDFDGRKTKNNYKRAAQVMDILSKTTYPHYLTDHQGRGPHIHIFTVTPEIGYAILKKLKTNSAEILYGRHMVRCEGSLYKNNKTYKSVFKTIEDIVPIESPEKVVFPIINLNKQTQVNNFQHRKNKQLAQEYIPQPPPSKCNVDWSMDNLPPKYRYLKDGVSKGERDINLCVLVGVFKRCGLTRSDALSQLRLFNQRCSPPLNDCVVQEKIRRLY